MKGIDHRPGKRAQQKDTARAKLAMDFEESPPHCGECVHFAGAGFSHYPPRKPKAGICQLGLFRVKSYSICNRWQNSAGVVLDDNQVDENPQPHSGVDQ